MALSNNTILVRVICTAGNSRIVPHIDALYFLSAGQINLTTELPQLFYICRLPNEVISFQSIPYDSTMNDIGETAPKNAEDKDAGWAETRPNNEAKSLPLDSTATTQKSKKLINFDEQTVYEDAGYNRNSTQIAEYVDRIFQDFPTPSERYYDIRFVSKKDRKSSFGEVGDQCLMFHSNRICLVTLAPSHPVIAENKTISKIDFTFDGNINRLETKPLGKFKKGGQRLPKYAPLCAIDCSDGTKYVVTACIPSRLVEVNEELQMNFNLVKEKPLSDGFIAIVMPNNWNYMEELKKSYPKLGEHQAEVGSGAKADQV